MELLGLTTQAELARRLGISPEAVYQWDEAEIPELRRLQVLHLVQEAKAA